MTTPETTTKSMAALADILRQNGVEVTQVCEADDDPLFSIPEIVFFGDKKIAFQAANIALTLGYPLHHFGCIWYVVGQEPIKTSESWILTFTASLFAK